VRVVVDIGSEVRFVQGDAKDPDRVFVDITPARLNSALIGKQWPVKSGLLQQIRVGQYDASTVRVVLNVGTSGRVTTFSLRDPDRIIIDVLGKELVNTVAVSAPSARVVSDTATQPALSGPRKTSVSKTPTPAPAPEPKVIVPAKVTNAGTTSLVRSLGLKLS